MEQHNSCETVSIPLPRPIKSVRLAGVEVGLSQVEILAGLDARRKAEETVRRFEEESEYVHEILNEIGDKVKEIPNVVAKRLDEWRPFFVDLALNLAERVIHTALDREDYDLAPVASRLVERARNISGGTGITVYVNPGDLSAILSRLQSLGDSSILDPTVRFETNPALSRGSCRVETEAGRLVFDPMEFFNEVGEIVREELGGNDEES